VDVPDRPDQFPAYLDYLRFKHWYTDRVATWAVETYRKLGVDIPIYLNGYDGLGVQNWVHFDQIADFYGLDTYPTNEFARWPDEFRFLLEKAGIAGRFPSFHILLNMNQAAGMGGTMIPSR